MLPKEFKPNHLYELIRLGKDNDGGYLVCKNSVKTSTALISFGLNDDCSFEQDFKKENNIRVICFDCNTGGGFWFKKFRRALRKFVKGETILLKDFLINIYNYYSFFSKNSSSIYKFRIVGKKDDDLSSNEININTILKNNNLKKDFFLKIDIEGSEYEILEDIIFYAKFLRGLVIEFHDVDLNLEKISNFINSIDLKLIHIHPNNSSNCRNNVPLCLELSFGRDPVIISNLVNFPHNLDQKNDKRNSDLKLIFY